LYNNEGVFLNMSSQMTLDGVEVNKKVEVVEIRGGWGIRQRLYQMGIHQGDKITVKRSGIMNGPILIKIHGVEVALGRGMARKILIEESS
jgi:ferrous iron transport protein A